MTSNGVATRKQARQVVEIAFSGLERPCDLSGIEKVSDLKLLLEKECGVPQNSQIVLIGKPYRHPSSSASVQAELERVDAQRRNMFLYDRREIDLARKAAADSAEPGSSAAPAIHLIDPDSKQEWTSNRLYIATAEQIQSVGGAALESHGNPVAGAFDDPMSLLRALDQELPEENRLAAARLSAAITGATRGRSESGATSDRGAGAGGSGKASGGGGQHGRSKAGERTDGDGLTMKLEGPALAVFLATKSRYSRIVGWHRMAQKAPALLRLRVSGGTAAAQRAGVRARALDAATSNLVDMASGTIHRFERFYRRFVSASSERISMLQKAPEYCDRLAQVLLHPALQSTSGARDSSGPSSAAVWNTKVNGSDDTADASGSHKKTLLDCIDKQGAMGWARGCLASEKRLRALARCLHGSATKLYSRCESASSDAPVPKDVSEAIHRAVHQLQSRAEAGWSAADDALKVSRQTVVQLHKSAALLAKQSLDSAAMDEMRSTREELDSMQRRLEDELLPALIQDDSPLRESALKVCSAENLVLARLRSRMAEISELHREMSELRKQMQQLVQAEKMQQSAVAQVSRIRGMPAAYTSALREVARRRAFARFYVTQVQRVWDGLERARTREAQRRVQFDRMHGGVLPAGLIPGMDEKAPVFEVRWEGISSQLPRIDNIDEVLEKGNASDVARRDQTAAHYSEGLSSANPRNASRRKGSESSIGSDESSGSRSNEFRLAEVSLDKEEDIAAQGLASKLGLEAEVAGLKAELAQMAQWYALGSGLGEEVAKVYLEGHGRMASSQVSSATPDSAGAARARSGTEPPALAEAADPSRDADDQPIDLGVNSGQDLDLDLDDELPERVPWSHARIPTHGYSMKETVAAVAARENELQAQNTDVSMVLEEESHDPSNGIASRRPQVSIALPAQVATAADATDGGGDDSVFDFVVSPIVPGGLDVRVSGLLAPSSAGSGRMSAGTPMSADTEDSGGAVVRSASAGPPGGASHVVRRLRAQVSQGGMRRPDGSLAPWLASSTRPTGKLSAGQALWRVLQLLRDSRALDAAEDAEAAADSSRAMGWKQLRWRGGTGGRAGSEGVGLRPVHSEGELPDALMKSLGMLNHLDVDSHDDDDTDEDTDVDGAKARADLVLADSSPTGDHLNDSSPLPDSGVTKSSENALNTPKQPRLVHGEQQQQPPRSGSSTSSTPPQHRMGGIANIRPGRVVDQLRKVLRFLQGLQQANAELSVRAADLDRDRRDRAVLRGDVQPQDLVVFHARTVPAAAGYSGFAPEDGAAPHGSSGVGARGNTKQKKSKEVKKTNSTASHSSDHKSQEAPVSSGRNRRESDKSSVGVSAPIVVYEAISYREAGSDARPVRILLRARAAEQAVTMAGGSWPSIVVAQVRKLLPRTVNAPPRSITPGSHAHDAPVIETGLGTGPMGSSIASSEGRFSPGLELGAASDAELGLAMLRFGLEPGAEFVVAVADVLFVEDDEKDD